MLNSSWEKKNTVILDSNISSPNEVIIGALIRASMHNLSIAIVDTTGSMKKIIQSFENFSLSKDFINHARKFRIDTFVPKHTMISKGILTAVEFQTISYELMFDQLSSYDVILFDHPSDSFLYDTRTLNLFREKSQRQTILVSLNEMPHTPLSSYFDDIVSQKHEKHNTLMSNSQIILSNDSLYGSLYGIGIVFLEFIAKNQIKYIAIDKADPAYGEHIFFGALKKFQTTTRFYGELDFLVTGIPRIEKENKRRASNLADRREIVETISLLKTTISKGYPLVIDNLDSALKEKILFEEELFDVLSNVKGRTYISSSLIHEKLFPYSGETIIFSKENMIVDSAEKLD